MYRYFIVCVCLLASPAFAEDWDVNPQEATLSVGRGFPKFSHNILGKYGHINFNRLVLDQGFSQELELDGIDFIQNPAFIPLASVPRERAPVGCTVDQLREIHRRSDEQIEEMFSEHFDRSQIARIRAASYRKFADIYGVEELLKLPAVRQSLQIDEAMTSQLLSKCQELRFDVQRDGDDILGDAVRMILNAMEANSRTEFFAMCNLEQDIFQDFPREVLVATLPIDSSLRATKQELGPGGMLVNPPDKKDLLWEIDRLIRAEKFTLDSDRQRKLFPADYGGRPLRESERQQANAMVRTLLSEEEYGKIESQFWLRMLGGTTFENFFKSATAIRRLEMSASEAERMGSVAAEVQKQMLDWLPPSKMKGEAFNEVELSGPARLFLRAYCR